MVFSTKNSLTVCGFLHQELLKTVYGFLHQELLNSRWFSPLRTICIHNSISGRSTHFSKYNTDVIIHSSISLLNLDIVMSDVQYWYGH